MSQKVMIDLRSHPEYKPASTSHWATECRYCRAPIAWASWINPANGNIVEMPVTPGTMEFHVNVCPEQRARHPKLVKEHPTFKDIRALQAEQITGLRSELASQKELYEAVVDGLKKDLITARANKAAPLMAVETTDPSLLPAALERVVSRLEGRLVKAMLRSSKGRTLKKTHKRTGKRLRRWKTAPVKVKERAVSMLRGGMTQAEIARETGIPQTTLSRWLASAKAGKGRAGRTTIRKA